MEESMRKRLEVIKMRHEEIDEELADPSIGDPFLGFNTTKFGI